MLHIAKRTSVLFMLAILITSMSMFMLVNNNVFASEDALFVTPTPMTQSWIDPGLCC